MKRKRKTSESSIRFEAFLLIASIVMIIGSLTPWESMQIAQGVHRVNALDTWHAPLAFAGGFVALFASTVSYRLYRIGFLQKNRPFTDGLLGIIGSVMVLIGSIVFFATIETPFGPAWGLYLTIFAGAFGLLSGIGVFKESSPRIPKGYSEKGITP